MKNQEEKSQRAVQGLIEGASRQLDLSFEQLQKERLKS